MTENLLINDAVLEYAGSSLVAAAARTLEGNVARPTDDLETVLNVGARVTANLYGLQLARYALADAAKTTAHAITSVMQLSGDLDAEIADLLRPGFAVPGMRH